MKIDESTLDRIAGLARIELGDPAKRTAMLQDMQRVIEFVNALSAVDTQGVEPLIFLNEEEEDVLRTDEPRMEITKEQAMANAPMKDSDYFKVPRVVG
jgi:aspartyl-tRNA(Asn)/glutamyl-tRNA(Gln) amidotransferase subunit C